MDSTKTIMEILQSIAGTFAGHIRSFGGYRGWQGEPAALQNGRWVWQSRSPEGMVARWLLTTVPDRRAAVFSVEVSNPTTAAVKLHYANFMEIVLVPPMQRPYRIFRIGGGSQDGSYPPNSYRTEQVSVYDSIFSSSDPVSGRTTGQYLPLTMVAAPDGSGIWFGLEWSGSWEHTERVNTDGSFSIVPRPDIWAVTLAPGESRKLPALHFGFFHHDFEEGTNSLRRYLYEKVCPRHMGKPVLPPLSYDHYFGIGNDWDEAFLLTQVDRAAELGLEFFVLDGGWETGGFPSGTGNWQADPARLPRGMKPLADYVRGKGMKFGIWVEPERAVKGTNWATRYPKLFLEAKNSNGLHLDLSKPAAQDLVIQWLDGLITEYGIEWMRYDYNISPFPYLKPLDETLEIQYAYMEGLYRVFDTVMQRHPQWFVETCATGAQRLDIGTMRRAHCSWASDQSEYPHICRYMQLSANRFIPGHLLNSAVVTHRTPKEAWSAANLAEIANADLGKGQVSFNCGQARWGVYSDPAMARRRRFGPGGLSEFDVVSRMAGALSFGGDIASWPVELTGRVRKCVEVYKQIRHLLVQDYYRLLPVPTDETTFDAGQFVSYDRQQSVLFVYRTHGNADCQMIRLKGLRDGQYRIERPLEKVSAQTRAGSELMSHGVDVTLPENGALLLTLNIIKG